MTPQIRRLFCCLFFLALLGIAVGSLLPASQVKSVFVVKDWLVHFLAYSACAICAVLGFATRPHRYYALVGVAIMGMAIEIVQPNFGRSFGWHDLAANTTGVFMALAIDQLRQLGEFGAAGRTAESETA